MELGYKESAGVLEPGVNNVTPVTFFQFEEGKYGDQVYFEFGFGDLTIKHWVQPPSKTNSKGEPNTKYKTQADAFNATLSQFLTGFYPESDKVTLREKINAAANLANGSIATYCEELAKLLPKDWQSREAELIMHYKADDAKYLSVPKSAKMNGGRIFNAHPSRTLTVTPFMQNIIDSVKGGQQTTTSAPAGDTSIPENTNWGEE